MNVFVIIVQAVANYMTTVRAIFTIVYAITIQKNVNQFRIFVYVVRTLAEHAKVIHTIAYVHFTAAHYFANQLATSVFVATTDQKNASM